MAIDWKELSKTTSSFDSLTETLGVDGKTVVDKNYSGLYVKMSELEFQGSPGNSVTVWADTVVMDQFFNSAGTTIFARQIICESFPRNPDGTLPPFVISPPKANQDFCQFLVGGIMGGGNLELNVFPKEDVVMTVPTDLKDLQVATLVVDPDGKSTPAIEKNYLALWDLIGRPWALNAFNASYAAAAELIDQGGDENLAEAKSMLRWIITAINKLGMEGNSLPLAQALLLSQASSLLTTINVSSGAVYVPLLSSVYYESEASKLLDALGAYDADFNTLTIEKDIAKAIASVSASLEQTAGIQDSPLKTDLDSVVNNAAAVNDTIQDLRQEFDLQSLRVQTDKALLEAAIEDQQMKEFLSSYFETVVNIGKAGVSVGKLAGGDASALGDAIEGTLQAGVSAIDTIGKLDAAFSGGESKNMLASATTLINSQTAVANAFLSSNLIWEKIKAGQPIPVLPEVPTAESFDTELAWNKFEIEAKLVCEGQVAAIGTGKFSGDTLAAARQYFASLQVLILYGKGVNAKMITYAGLLARAVLLKSEIEANEKIQKIWDNLNKNSKDEEEKLQALRGLVSSKRNAIKRSLFAAWRNYRAAYMYIFLTEPPAATNINMRMSTGDLRTSFALITTWIGNLLATPGSSGKITLPNNNVKLDLSFPIFRADESNPDPNQTVAVLYPGSGSVPTTITLAIPPAAQELQGMLPSEGKVPIWITAGQFRVKGAVPNSKGNVILDVSTSGSYQNGNIVANDFHVFSFETKGMGSSFGYKPNEQEPYMPWNVDAVVYMTPTLFTQWTIVLDSNGGDLSKASSLDLTFTITFRSNNIA